jgi:hypothetical protein
MDVAQSDSRIAEDSDLTERKKGRVEQLVDKAATGLGEGIEFLADKGILFLAFLVIWVAFGIALVWSQGSLEAAWQWVRDLPWLLEGLVWLLFLPVMLGLWIWETSWSLILKLALIVGLAGWTLLILPRPWK